MKTLIAAFLIIICIPGLGISEDFQIPNKFEDNETIKAEKLNQNYEEIEKEITDLKQLLENMIPKGTVAAFDLEKCPDGWSNFNEGAGRVILGIGQGKGLSERKLRDEGGQEKVGLVEAQIPRHFHYVPARGGGRNIPKTWALQAANKGNWGPPHARQTDTRGDNKPHENMPPFITLRFCKKD
jgi:hypothetical protein